MPQSVWWMRTISSVPSSRCEIASERIVSSVTTPPALRMTCASPSSRPRIRVGIMRASMHATTATFLAGGIGRSPLSKRSAYCSALRRRSSVVLMATTYRKADRICRNSPPCSRARGGEQLLARGELHPRALALPAERALVRVDGPPALHRDGVRPALGQQRVDLLARRPAGGGAPAPPEAPRHPGPRLPPLPPVWCHGPPPP